MGSTISACLPYLTNSAQISSWFKHLSPLHNEPHLSSDSELVADSKAKYSSSQVITCTYISIRPSESSPDLHEFDFRP